MSHLGKYFKSERKIRGLTRGQLAKKAGLSNISKWARRIYEMEQEGKVNRLLLERIVNFLTIDPRIMNELAKKDHQESLAAFEKWVNEPVPMELIVRVIPGVYGDVPIPDHMTPEEAESWACETAREYKKKVCLREKGEGKRERQTAAIRFPSRHICSHAMLPLLHPTKNGEQTFLS